MSTIWKDGMFGLIVGDALGVPVEFTSRADRKADPVVDMREYGTHNQPAGTWSDDSSMALLKRFFFWRKFRFFKRIFIWKLFWQHFIRKLFQRLFIRKFFNFDRHFCKIDR